MVHNQEPSAKASWHTCEQRSTGKVVQMLTYKRKLRGFVGKTTEEDLPSLESDNSGARAAQEPAELKKS
jgi:hypothetical protein